MSKTAVDRQSLEGDGMFVHLAQREKELAEKEKAVGDLKMKIEGADELRRQLEVHAQELVLKEAQLREKERIHGWVDEREEALTSSEQRLAVLEQDLNTRLRNVMVKEKELAVESKVRIQQYEEMIAPLTDREERCLEREQEIHQLELKTQNFVKSETQRMDEINTATRSWEEKAAAHQRATAAVHRAIEAKEMELDTLREEVLIDQKTQKKKLEDIEQRTRNVEWKEREVEHQLQHCRDRETDHRKTSDELYQKQEELNCKEAQTIRRQSVLEEKHTQLKANARRLISADDEITSKHEAANRREERLQFQAADLTRRSRIITTKEGVIAQREADLEIATQRCAETQGRLDVQIVLYKKKMTHVTTLESDVLKWLRVVKWKENAIQKSLTASSFSLVFPRTSQKDEPTLRSNTALVHHELQQIQAHYRGAALRRPVEGKKCSVFEDTLSETRVLVGLEKKCLGLAVRLAEYLAQHQVVDERLDDLPIRGSDPGIKLPEDVELFKKLTEADQVELRRCLRDERGLTSELVFLQSMFKSPLTKRLNSESDGSVIRNMEVWYTKSRKILNERYRQLLSERASLLTTATNLFNRTTKLSPHFSQRTDLTTRLHTAPPVPSTFVNSPTSVVKKAAAAALLADKPRTRAPKLAPLDTILTQVRVRPMPHDATVNYLTHYLNLPPPPADYSTDDPTESPRSVKPEQPKQDCETVSPTSDAAPGVQLKSESRPASSSGPIPPPTPPGPVSSPNEGLGAVTPDGEYSMSDTASSGYTSSV